MFLNDGTATHHSYSYNTSEALDITIVSPELYSRCNWKVMEGIGSDHKPILVETKVIFTTGKCKTKFWNFRKANWTNYKSRLNEILSKNSPEGNLEGKWKFLKNAILKAAKYAIPKGRRKKWDTQLCTS